MTRLVALTYGTFAVLSGLIRIVLLGQLISGVVGLVISAIILWFFIRRANFARWLIAAGALFGAIASIISAFGLEGGFTAHPIAGIIILAFAAIDIALFGIVIFSEDINREFGT